MKNNKNLLIKGDNIEILPKLVEYYKSKIKLIYIDPPYNTQSKFTYVDKREDWEDFIKIRLELAKDLLKEDGVIFISIDDSKFSELKKICNIIFENKNFLGTFVTKQSNRSNSKHINIIHEYIIVYAKNKSKVRPFKIKRIDKQEESKVIYKLIREINNEFYKNKDIKLTEKKLKQRIKSILNVNNNYSWLKNYSNVDPDGKIFFAKDLSTPSEPRKVELPSINLFLEPLKNRGWSSDKLLLQLHKNNRLFFKGYRPYSIHYLEESEDNIQSILNFYSRQGTRDLELLDMGGIFDYPKPVDMIKYLISITCEKNDTILDFFAGSGTTGQAVLEINKIKDLDLNFILVQSEEYIIKNDKISMFEHKNNINIESIFDICNERISRVCDKLGIVMKNEVEIIDYE